MAKTTSSPAELAERQQQAARLAVQCQRRGVALPPPLLFMLDCRVAALTRLLVEHGGVTQADIDRMVLDQQIQTFEALLANAARPTLLTPHGKVTV